MHLRLHLLQLRRLGVLSVTMVERIPGLSFAPFELMEDDDHFEAILGQDVVDTLPA